MLAELSEDNQRLTRSMREAHEVCDRHSDVATASMLENWIDESERRPGSCRRLWAVARALRLEHNRVLMIGIRPGIDAPRL